jgi:hypothetical protein
VDGNKTLTPTIAKLLLDLGVSKQVTTVSISFVYLLVQNFGLPLVVYAATRKKSISIIVAFAFLFVLGNIEPIYSFITSGFITGNLSTSIFLMEIGFAILGFYWASIIILIFHIFVHPTTFLMWTPLVLLVFYLKRNGLSNENSKIKFIFIYLSLIFYPSVVALVCYLYELNFYAMSEIQSNDYWKMATISFYHTKFLDNGKFINVLTYIFSLFSLIIISSSALLTKIHRNYLKIICAYGFGILISTIIFVESGVSIIFSMTLPFRFAVILYVAIFLTYLVVALRGSNQTKAVALLIIVSLFLNSLNEYFYYFNKPLLFSAFFSGFLLYVNHEINLKNVLWNHFKCSKKRS